MASAQLAGIKQRISAARQQAGVTDDRYDVAAARASLGWLELADADGCEFELLRLGALPLRWITTPASDPDRRIVYCHGGGYLAGGYASHHTLATWLAHLSGCAVLFPDYRLAPEHPFPAAVQDAGAALALAFEQGPAGRRVAARAVYVAGDSAGAGLCIAAMVERRRHGLALPAAAALLCGLLDLDINRSAYLKSSARARDMVRQYVARAADLADPLACTIDAPLAGLPPLLLQTGTDDYCCDDSLRFAARASASGVAVTLRIWPEMIHVWQRYVPLLPEARQALDEVAAFFAVRAPV